MNDDEMSPAPQVVRLFDVLSLPERGHVYLLVDTLLCADFWSFWSSFQPNALDSWCYLYAGTPYQEWDNISPVLVEVSEGGAGETLFYWMVEQAAFMQACTLMTSALSLKQLHAHWQSRISCYHPDGREALLPCYSSAMLLPWWDTLSVDEQRGFMGRISSYYLPYDAQGGLHCWYTVGDTDFCDEFATPYPLDNVQHQRLTLDYRRHGMANEIFLRLSEETPFLLDIERVKALFLESIALAKSRYPKETDLAHETFATYRFILGSEFFSHPVFETLLQKHPLRDSIQILNDSEQYTKELQTEHHCHEWLGSAAQQGSQV